MFDIGFWEMLVIGVMALLILGPERLPGAIKSTMSTIRSIKQMATGFKDEVASQIDAHELHENLKKAEQMGMQNIGKDLQASVDELKAAAQSVQRPYEMPDKTPSHEQDISQSVLTNTQPTTQALTSATSDSNDVELSLDINNHQDEKVPVKQQTEQISLSLGEHESQAHHAHNDEKENANDNKQSSGKA